MHRVDLRYLGAGTLRQQRGLPHFAGQRADQQDPHHVSRCDPP